MELEFSLAPETIFHLGPLPITNTLLMSWVVVLVLIGLGLLLRRNITFVPTGFQAWVEAAFEQLIDLMESATEDRQLAMRALPVVATIFIFVLLANWIELLPGLGTIKVQGMHGGEHAMVPLIRAASADLNLTIALGVVSFFAVQTFGIAALGIFKYAGKFINLKSPLTFFVGILELVSEVTKVVSFSFRLFGNIFAGEVLLLVVLFLVPYLIPLPFLFLEIFVGLIQAFIFAMLTLIFIKVATAEAH